MSMQLEDETTLEDQQPTRTSGEPGRAVAAGIPTQRDLAFKTFGVMDTGAQTKSSVATSLIVNGIAVALITLISLTVKKVIKPVTVTTLTAPVLVPKEEPPPPPPPPPKLPRPPIMKVTPPPPPKDVPKIEVPDPPKVQPVIMKSAPTPAPVTPAPKAVTPPPAPMPVAVKIAQAASVPNNDPHPSPIRVGSLSNPINNTAGPAVSPVNLGRSGAPGMAAGNTGLGAPSKIAIGGSGSPNGSMGGRDSGPQPIKGINTGITGGTGPNSARPVGAVQIAKSVVPTPINNATPAATTPAKVAPKLIFKPRPEYTEEARQMHLEGTVFVKIHVSAAGVVTVVGVQSGLGHGLDQSAIHAVQGMRFQPALQNGQPADWDGVVNIIFQLAG
jgi:TonB family protein